MHELIHKELSESIIGASMTVLNALKPGLDEKLYERAMTIELQRRGHQASAQSCFPVFYRGELIGNLVPDLNVDDDVIVDPKVATCFTEAHVAQMRHAPDRARLARQQRRRHDRQHGILRAADRHFSVQRHAAFN